MGVFTAYSVSTQNTDKKMLLEARIEGGEDWLHQLEADSRFD